MSTTANVHFRSKPTYLYRPAQTGHLTVEKKGKKNVFNGRILEIEGLPDLTCEQAFELSDASAERSAAGCTIKLGKVRRRYVVCVLDAYVCCSAQFDCAQRNFGGCVYPTVLCRIQRRYDLVQIWQWMCGLLY
jgi:hypothetical protein